MDSIDDLKIIDPHIERIILNNDKKIKGYCGGRKYKITKEGPFITKCDYVNRILNYEHNDRIRRD